MGQVMFPQGLYNLPIPEYIGPAMPDTYNDQRFLSRAWTHLKFVWWPCRCHVSGRWLWLTHAYRADYVITGPGEPASWTRWYSSTEFLILKLKGYVYDDIYN
jgi:hypothetical protein